MFENARGLMLWQGGSYRYVNGNPTAAKSWKEANVFPEDGHPQHDRDLIEQRSKMLFTLSQLRVP
jgi:hypothetical protein